MKNKEFLTLQLFAEDGAITAADLEPAISVDFVSRLHGNITELQKLLGIADLDPMSEGTTIKIYKMEQVTTPEQVAEGEEIGLTKVKKTYVKSIELTLQKFRKKTTAEAIQRHGREVAINKTDEKVVSNIQKNIKKEFYAVISEGTGKASGSNLQAALSAAWGAVVKFYEDEDATPIYFVSSDDVADYLGKAQVTMQNAFGMSYIEDFLGLGTVVIAPTLRKGKLIATAKENLRGVYIPTNKGDLAESFALTSDETGLIGMTHAIATGTASIETLIFSGVVFYPEFLDGVVVATIGEDQELGTLNVVSEEGTAAGTTKLTVSPGKGSSNIYKYKLSESAVDVFYGQNVKTWSVWNGTDDITASAGQTVTVVEADASYGAIKVGSATVTIKA